MSTDEHSPLDRALAAVHPRRVVLAALASVGAAAAIAPAADLAAKKKKKKKVWTDRAQFGSAGTGDGNLNFPASVTVSANGRTAWVADTENHRISVWTRPTSTSTEWSHSVNFGSAGTGDANFNYPWGVTVSVDGRTIWVADKDNHRISVWTRTTNTSADWSHSINFGSEGSGNTNFNYPYGVAVSADGRTAWVADTFNNRISVWTRTTNTSTDWSPSYTFGSQGTGDAYFWEPIGVAVSADERTVWVADNRNNRISVWTRPTGSSTTWSHSINFGSVGSEDANLTYPADVAVSANGRSAWVADSFNNRISVWTRPTGSSTEWSHSINFGSEGSGVAVSADGRTVWVVASYPGHISIWTYS